MLQLDVSRIRQALTHLRATKPDVFGADVHQFQTNKPLADADIRAFERKYGVELPSDYRHFITDVGNGGAGPFYGIFPLGKRDAAVGSGEEDWAERDGIVGVLTEPFPLESEWNDTSAMPPDSLAISDEALHERQMNEFEAQYWRSSLVNGAIPICHQGCALRVWLVINGKHAGTLWDDRRSEYAGLRPIQLRNGQTATFATWYEEWLEACCSTVPR